MAIGQPIDIVTPAVLRRQALAQQIQQQYAANRGGQKQLQAINQSMIHAMPMFGPSGGGRDSANLPGAPAPPLSIPFMQQPGGPGPNAPMMGGPSPNGPMMGPSPQQGQMPSDPGMPAQAPNLGVTQSSNPNAQMQPIMDPNAVMTVFGGQNPRRLYGGGGQQVPQGTMLQPRQIGLM